MPITAKFHVVGMEALIDNTLTLFENNFKAMIDVRYPAEATLIQGDAQYLPDFQERALGMVMGEQAPHLGISPSRKASTSSDDDSYLKEALRMDLAMGVTDDGPQTVTRRIIRYMETSEAVLRRGNKNDFFGISNTAHNWGFDLDCEHVYRPEIRGNDAGIYYRSATLQVTITIHEGQ